MADQVAPPAPAVSLAAAPYSPAGPAYHQPAPAGPVLLEKPYETKTVQALPVSVHQTYTGFACRRRYPGRHYADPEAGCEIYHFCHEDGKQDTFHCGYGTAFNEYLGTCDHESSVHCVTGEGYQPPAPAPYSPSPPSNSLHSPRCPSSLHSPSSSLSI